MNAQVLRFAQDDSSPLSQHFWGTGKSMPGDDGGLDVSAAVQHVAEHLLQTRQRSLPGDVVGGTNLFRCDQSKSAAHGLGGVMESGLKGNLRVMQAVGVELDFGTAGAASEEVYVATFAYHFNRPLPRFRSAHRLDHDVATALLR